MIPERSTQLRLDRVSLNVPIAGAKIGMPILNEISFEVKSGDCVAIVGPSGAGKTSLLRLMNRLIEPSSGVLYFQERDYRTLKPILLRQQIPLVLQESKLLGMKVKDAIAYPLTLRGMPAVQIAPRVATWIERLHLPTEWLERTEAQLSVGQRQLVALCRALVIQPPVLLLDEPTSALDAGRSAHLLQVLSEVANSTQTAIVMVNHQLELAQQFCTRLLYLQHGQLIYDLSHEQVDWEQLRGAIVEAETVAAQEWE